ncbi:MAG: bifunctional phosphopantothenoylcysteine decarboxylase/phosphopantothenate--cysteine ligase CoaBC [Sandaracinus sp.]|nr:bifunctional phosphopantothenoylcysteine decarboxylase/phosphopantothenate--cysteine ligase CoaBC [Sandaracinus sp.]
MLEGRRIVVALGGGIAAFKAVALVRELGRRGAEVRVVMTEAATRFVGPVTFAGLTGRPAVTNLWDPSYAGEVHVELGAWADAVVVAPATMNLLARAANGLADDVVLATIACARGALLFAPAMHERMWSRGSTQRNVAALASDGARFVGPVEGALASGEVGRGRMAEPEAIADATEALFAPQDFEGRHVVVSAGPTHEDLDPVRFLGNRSTGRMGFAIAAAAAARGARVTLVAGPVTLGTPSGVTRIDVRSALELEAAVTKAAADADAVVMAAAVADYRPAERTEQKRKKQEGPLVLELVRNPDVLAGLGAARTGTLPVLVGFALETEKVVENARDKLRRKKVDLVVANHASDGFGGDDNVVTLVEEGGEEALSKQTKRAIADRILDRIRARLAAS